MRHWLRGVLARVFPTARLDETPDSLPFAVAAKPDEPPASPRQVIKMANGDEWEV